MSPVEQAIFTLDASAGALVGPALTWLQAHGGDPLERPGPLREYLTSVLPRVADQDDRAQHEVAWALGDLCELSGLREQAALCRSVETHRRIAVWGWVHSFPGLPEAFWQPALSAVEAPARVPARAALSLSSARALLGAVGDGLPTGPSGGLPRETVAALDDRFRWTEEFPWLRGAGASDLPPLTFLHQHLLAQRLLREVDGRLTRTTEGVAATTDTARLWRSVVDPSPRWTREFDRDVLGVLAASVLRSADVALGRLGEEITHVLAAKWRPVEQGSLFDGASAVAQAWYQVGVPLGWWDTGRGPADRRPNVFGRAAATAVFRAVAEPPRPAAPA